MEGRQNDLVVPCALKFKASALLRMVTALSLNVLCTWKKTDREESNYHALRLREFPLIKLQNHKAVMLKILNCSKLNLFFVSLVSRLQLPCPDALLDIKVNVLVVITVCISAHARTETSRFSIQNF